MFLTKWNGISFLRTPYITCPQDHQIQTDTSGSWGCGAHFNGRWLQHPWPSEWAPVNIMAKEMVPIVLSCAVWGKLLSKQRVEFRCDNHSLVDAITKGSSKEDMVMHLLRSLWFFTVVFDIEITTSHIPGVQNTAADLLSRNQLEGFLVMNPLASQKPNTDQTSSCTPDFSNTTRLDACIIST